MKKIIMLTLLLLLLFVFTANALISGAYLNEAASTAYSGSIVSENIGRGVMTTLSVSDCDCRIHLYKWEYDDWFSKDREESSPGNNAYTSMDQPGTYRIMLMQLDDNGIASGFVRDYWDYY